jgi:hypothetical protein
MTGCERVSAPEVDIHDSATNGTHVGGGGGKRRLVVQRLLIVRVVGSANLIHEDGFHANRTVTKVLLTRLRVADRQRLMIIVRRGRCELEMGTYISDCNSNGHDELRLTLCGRLRNQGNRCQPKQFGKASDAVKLTKTMHQTVPAPRARVPEPKHRSEATKSNLNLSISFKSIEGKLLALTIGFHEEYIVGTAECIWIM